MMETVAAESQVLSCHGLEMEFAGLRGERVKALENVSLSARRGVVTGIVGPDGAGKTTFIRLVAGLLTPRAGTVRVLGIDVGSTPQAAQSRIGYMPQRFGLYEDLTVRENLDLYGDLHGISAEIRADRYPGLMRMTGLARFMDRLAGRLSGGMKQKLGLACTLVSTPDLLLLDEPTVGVDPLSRRELWEIVHHLVQERGVTVLLGTSYLDEAERCDHTVVLLQGRVLASGPPGDIVRVAEGRSFRVEPPAPLKPRQLQALLADQDWVTDASLEGSRVRFITNDGLPAMSPVFRKEAVKPVKPRFEDGFMVLLRRAAEGESRSVVSHGGEGEEGNVDGDAGRVSARAPSPDVGLSPVVPVSATGREIVVEVRDLVRQFGSFHAVRDVSFQVCRGEIFGLLGPNGAGKSTTFRMLCGLLPATSGTLSVAGTDLRRARASARQRIGYVAQKFSLYGQLTVLENLDFFASAYGLAGARKRDRIRWAVQQFDLDRHGGSAGEELPGGYRQRLAMACALMHEPEILFLDEPTSGADPLARREFWHRISGLADRGVTIIVTTHFMEEAEYCDRMVIMVDGRILATGAPADIRRLAMAEPGGEPTIEDAFIAIVEAHHQASQERKD
ncbi:MAG: ATP-binding cassette domain-containing protein [Syntrophobacteraceae bacterium]|jgi:ABC-2 type transport system ATP-binding protein|nr:ATP-binding cassette domain-containing protein [Syntrophobacteraceae bacterium]